MPKSSKKQIVEDEKKVLFELQRNANESIDAIAKKCGFSRQKVWRIIKRLEKEKTIWGYTTVIDDDKLGLSKYFILLKRVQKPVPEESINKVISRDLKKEIEIIGAKIDCSFYLHGQFDYLICCTTENIKQVKKFCEILNKVFRESILDMEVLEVIFPVERCGIQNPNLEKIKELF